MEVDELKHFSKEKYAIHSMYMWINKLDMNQPIFYTYISQIVLINLWFYFWQKYVCFALKRMHEQIYILFVKKIIYLKYIFFYFRVEIDNQKFFCGLKKKRLILAMEWRSIPWRFDGKHAILILSDGQRQFTLQYGGYHVEKGVDSWHGLRARWIFVEHHFVCVCLCIFRMFYKLLVLSTFDLFYKWIIIIFLI